MDYQELLTGLAVDLAAITLLTYALYFQRHQRRDLTLGLVGINVGLFAVSSFTATNSISVGFGIGLFALLSVIRLRSTLASQEEIGYYFVALVLGLVNGLAVGDQWNVTITLNVTLLGVMFIADHPRVLRHAKRRLVVVKGVPRSLEAMTAKVEKLIGYEVTRMHVLEVDYVRKRSRVDVRFRSDRPVAPRGTTTDVTPSVGADATPGADAPPRADAAPGADAPPDAASPPQETKR